jgi:hypothetical protein
MVTVDHETNKLVNILLTNLSRFKNSENEVKKTIEEYFEHTEYFMNILDDCYGLISQSMQAIKTLQNENLNLKEQLKNAPEKCMPNLTLSNLDEKLETSSKDKSRISLRQQLRQGGNKKEQQRSLSTSFDNPETVKITNSIIMNSTVTDRYSVYFAEKYAKGSYKDFLHSLVTMKYPIDMLKEIQAEVERFDSLLKSVGQHGLAKYKTMINQIKPDDKGFGNVNKTSIEKGKQSYDRNKEMQTSKKSIKLNKTNY